MIADLQGFPSFAVVLFAKWNNVPTAVRRTGFLDMCANFWFLSAFVFWTKARQLLLAEFLPMIEPASAFAGVVTGAIDVVHFHNESPLKPLSARLPIETFTSPFNRFRWLNLFFSRE
jgi:hypothetical protein